MISPYLKYFRLKNFQYVVPSSSNAVKYLHYIQPEVELDVEDYSISLSFYSLVLSFFSFLKYFTNPEKSHNLIHSRYYADGFFHNGILVYGKKIICYYDSNTEILYISSDVTKEEKETIDSVLLYLMKRYNFYSTGSNTEFYYKIDCSQLLEFDYIFHIFDIIHYNSTDNYILNKFIDDTIPNLLEQGDTNSTAFYFANRRIENPLVCKILKYQKYPDSIIQNYFSYLRDTNLGEQTDVFYTLKKILEKYLFLTPLIPSDIDREELNDLGITVAEYNLLQGFIHSSSSELATLFGYYVDLWDGSKNEELLDYFRKRLHQSNLEAQESEEDAYFYDLERVNHH